LLDEVLALALLGNAAQLETIIQKAEANAATISVACSFLKNASNSN
jgi:hypothetical protein